MQQLDNAQIISRLISDTNHDCLDWEDALTEAQEFFPDLQILRAFKALTGMYDTDYFLAIEFLGQRYNPDYDSYFKENTYFVAYIGNGIVGHVIVESGLPNPIEISPLINIIAFKVSNAYNSINSFLEKRRDYDG